MDVERAARKAGEDLAAKERAFQARELDLQKQKTALVERERDIEKQRADFLEARAKSLGKGRGFGCVVKKIFTAGQGRCG